MEANLSTSFHATVQDDRAEVSEYVAKAGRHLLEEVTNLRARRTVAQGSSLVRDFTFDLVTAQMRIKLGAMTRVFLGYGNDAAGVRLNGVVSELLENDLVLLEEAVRLRAGVTSALDTCMRSKVNISIAQDRLGENPVVAQSYRTRFKHAIPMALRVQLYPILLFGGVIISMLPGLAFAFGHACDLHLGKVILFTAFLWLFSGLLWRGLVLRPAKVWLSRCHEKAGIAGLDRSFGRMASFKPWARRVMMGGAVLLAAYALLTPYGVHVKKNGYRSVVMLLPEEWRPEELPSVEYRVLSRFVMQNQEIGRTWFYRGAFSLEGDTLQMPDGACTDAYVLPRPPHTGWGALLRGVWLEEFSGVIRLGTRERLSKLDSLEQANLVRFYVVVGSGGEAWEPLHGYFVPLTSASPEELSVYDLEQYRLVHYEDAKFNIVTGYFGRD